jgi:SPOR domain
MGTLAPEPPERPGEPAPAATSPDADAVTAPPESPDTPGEEAEIAEVPGAVEETASEAEAEAVEIAALVREATLDVATTPKPDPSEATPNAEASPLAPLPPARPADLRARIEESVRSAEASAAELARRAAASPVQIQLAADPDEEAVRAMWRRISQANSDILHDRDLAVQKTVSGGTTYYRLRVGPFAGTTEAHAVCQALKARGQDCIVARNG